MIMKKTAKITFSSIKNTDGWMNLIHELKFDKFKAKYPDLHEDDIEDKFYTEVVSKRFQYGEYGSFEIIVNEDLEIVGGKIY